MSNLREIKKRLLDRYKNNHTVKLKTTATKSGNASILIAPKGGDYLIGQMVVARFNGYYYTTIVDEILDKDHPEFKTTVANDTFIGVVDSCAQEKFREKLSEIACKLHKHIEDVEKQEFKAEAQEAFKLNEDEMKLFDL